jgi:hypothetical protein
MKILYDVGRFESALKAGFEVEQFDSDDIAYLEVDTRGDDIAVHVRPAARLTRFTAKRDDYFVPVDFGGKCDVGGVY